MKNVLVSLIFPIRPIKAQYSIIGNFNNVYFGEVINFIICMRVLFTQLSNIKDSILSV